MKVYQINVVCGMGSTGKIAADIGRAVVADGGKCRIAYGRGKAPEDVDSFKISDTSDLYYHALMTRLTDRHGLYSGRATKRLIDDIRKFDPDIIHLHNLHGYYVNYEMLFAFLKEYGKITKWTLHDCWAFTGHCAHFAAVGCEQWKTECRNCVQLERYPACSTKGNVQENYLRKKKAFTGVPGLELITPSHWLEELVRQSFLREYPLEVLYNPVDTEVFRPTQGEFRRKHDLQDRYMVLGVANIWDDRKGLQDMYYLADQLDEHYAVVVVGLSKKQLAHIPDRLIGIERTADARELASIYSEADVFVNPSVEESFGLTTVEAMACGTPAIVYRGTACEEIAKKCGGIVTEANGESLLRAVRDTDREHPVFDTEIFNKERYNRSILELYRSAMG